MIKIWTRTCPTWKIKIRTIATHRISSSSKIWTKIMKIMEIHSNKCNNSRLSKGERTSLRGRGSWTTRRTTLWIIKTKLMTKTELLLQQTTGTVKAHQLKTVTSSKKCKTLELWPQPPVAKSYHHLKVLKARRTRETRQRRRVLRVTELQSTATLRREDWWTTKEYKTRTITSNRHKITWISTIITSNRTILKTQIHTCKIKT